MDRFILERKERQWVLHDLELRIAHTDLKGMTEEVSRAIVWYLMIHGFDAMEKEDFEILLAAARGTGPNGGLALIGPHGPDPPGENPARE